MTGLENKKGGDPREEEGIAADVSAPQREEEGAELEAASKTARLRIW